MSKILITGGDGFIAGHLSKRLQEAGYTVISLSRNDGDIAVADTFATVEKVDHVFHLAARTFVPESWSDIDGFMKTNLLGTVNVLEYCKKNEATLTYTSAYVYGKPLILPIRENTQPHPNNPYALTKYMGEQACEFYAKHMGCGVAVVRPFNIYGPGQGAVFLIPKIIRSIQQNIPIELFDLAPKRDYIYISDLIDALVKTIGLIKQGYNVFNVGSGKSISVGDLVSLIQSLAGSNLEVKSKEVPRYEELDDVVADISHTKKVLNWVPSTSLEKGLSNLIYAK
ncbi:NAD-dependent epimerase/dehydratase family protein [Daejeonella sp.]|uniref:NAD-dependent epimerase/dehydratase family protein n=1 Tax=Daejeonella sp. TaxID=2805397 RepID=UPI002C15F040|nr:NAD-dependent epimerase/dehydratase family protein [Daejeonella sp.]HQS85063.1 NAD-dependent epimerase/dehydratase family protein [Alphaproteobacteria bacterium]HQT58833.1 NAD-dependent epimerase/dehydratase family protein [Daejeonella sp.]